jgi:AraC-like DNA-binding protein
MLKVNFHDPQPDISWLVRRFETIKKEANEDCLSDNFIPRPDIALVFNFKNKPEIQSKNIIKLPALIIAAITEKPLNLLLRGEIDSFIVICKPTVLTRILKMDIASHTFPHISVNNESLHNLYNDLSKVNSDNQRIKLFSQHFLPFIDNYYSPDYIDIIYEEIIHNCLNTNIREVSKIAACSISCLQRNFLKRTGTSMISLLRIARIFTVFNEMINNNSLKYQNILQKSNYYDQAHFIKDFRQITGKNPRKFLKENTDLCNIISGIN